jgi:hypothetical protein
MHHFVQTCARQKRQRRRQRLPTCHWQSCDRVVSTHRVRRAATNLPTLTLMLAAQIAVLRKTLNMIDSVIESRTAGGSAHESAFPAPVSNNNDAGGGDAHVMARSSTVSTSDAMRTDYSTRATPNLSAPCSSSVLAQQQQQRTWPASSSLPCYTTPVSVPSAIRALQLPSTSSASTSSVANTSAATSSVGGAEFTRCDFAWSDLIERVNRDVVREYVRSMSSHTISPSLAICRSASCSAR